MVKTIKALQQTLEQQGYKHWNKRFGSSLQDYTKRVETYSRRAAKRTKHYTDEDSIYLTRAGKRLWIQQLPKELQQDLKMAYIQITGDSRQQDMIDEWKMEMLLDDTEEYKIRDTARILVDNHYEWQVEPKIGSLEIMDRDEWIKWHDSDTDLDGTHREVEILDLIEQADRCDLWWGTDINDDDCVLGIYMNMDNTHRQLLRNEIQQIWLKRQHILKKIQECYKAAKLLEMA